MKERNALRRGFTTGTTAAAAAKGAFIYMLTGAVPDKIPVTLPDNSLIEVPLVRENSLIGAVKDSGDDPDVTNGITIFAQVRKITHYNQIVIKGGKGVGLATKPGLQVPVGAPAINPVPQRMIKDNVRQIADTQGMEVEIIIPEGKEIAQKTFNEKLGILGGLSILGTTGIVEPMSLDALKETIRCEINVAAASGSQTIGLVPGKIGENALKQCIASCIPIIQFSNFAGFAFEAALKKGIKKVILGGHPGKLAKIAMGFWNTHSSRSPQANEYIEKLFGLNKHFNTVEEIIKSLPQNERELKFSLLCQRIINIIYHQYAFTDLSIFLFDMEKNPITYCER